MTVTRAAFGRAYQSALRDVDTLAAAYASVVASVFAAHRRRVNGRLAAIRRSVAVTVPPLTDLSEPEYDQDPRLTHIRSSELFLDGLDGDLRDRMGPTIDRHVGLIGGLLIGVGWAQAGQAQDALVAAQTGRLGYIGTAVADRVDATLDAAYRAGDTFGGLGDRIGNLFDAFGSWYADRVGGDEAQTTLNGTATSALQWGGLVGVTRGWRCQRDERVREPHAAADFEEGDDPQIVGVAEPFIVDGEPLMFPGDPDGSPGNTINCRCELVILGPEGEPLVSDSSVDDEAAALEMDSAAGSP